MQNINENTKKKSTCKFKIDKTNYSKSQPRIMYHVGKNSWPLVYPQSYSEKNYIECTVKCLGRMYCQVSKNERKPYYISCCSE